MISRIIQFSVGNKMIVLLGVIALVIWGGVSLSRLPLDAIPDVTNEQVVIATQSPNLSAVEMEQFVSYPIEMAMRNIQGLEGIRSVSQFGLSIVTLDFKEGTDIYFARNQVNERLQAVKEEIPAGFGNPAMNPITTGLGEIFQYTIQPENPADTSWSDLELRTVQDWVVKKHLLGTEGVAEISSFGGLLKQYHVKTDPTLLRANGVTLAEVFTAIEQGNQNTGAAYIEKDARNYFIRGMGLAANERDLEQAVVKVNGGIPVLVRDVATVEIGSAIRYGALTQGNKEAVGGIVLMLKGENSRNVVLNVKERLKTVPLPKGLKLETFLDRELLIDRTIATVSRNLLEGGLIVVFILVLMLGHLRAGLVVATVIPLSMLFAVGCMVAFKVSGNLMSLGAIDFGLIVDGAVIIVENIISQLMARSKHDFSETPHLEGGADVEKLSTEQTIAQAASSMIGSSFFGQIIILIVYVPLLTLSGIEGKMFKPMALTVIFALTGAVLLSLTYVPAVSALMFKNTGSHGETFADRLMHRLAGGYKKIIEKALLHKKAVVAFAVGLLILAIGLFTRMGGEFIPQLDEGDYVIEIRMLPGSSLSSMVKTAEHAATAIQQAFPDEVRLCTGKIGTSEVPMDPMSIEEMDMVLTMYPAEHWKKVKTRAEFERALQEVLDGVPGVFTSIQQPIAMRFNELMSGAKTDVIVKVLGPDLDKLASVGQQIVKSIQHVPGAEDISISKAEGLPQLFVEYRRDALARYALSVSAVNEALQTAIAGRKAGILFEGNQRYDVIVRLQENRERPFEVLDQLMINTPAGIPVPLSELATVSIKNGPMAVNRIDGERCVNVALNVRGRDIQSVVSDVQQIVNQQIVLPEGYRVTYGGQFENLQNAQARLQLVVPAALLLILLLLYFSFGTVAESLLIFSAIPFAAVGGVLALWLRNMPFSISAGVGFIALFGVAVLNGMVLIGYFQQLEKEGVKDVYDRIRQGVLARFRPVIMTASVASLGFLPMAIAAGAGAEVQKPLATVVIGGLISATLLTLVILPVMYALVKGRRRKSGKKATAALALILLWANIDLNAQERLGPDQIIEMAINHYPSLVKAQHQVEEKKILAGTNMPVQPLQIYTWLPFNPEVGITQNFEPRSVIKADRAYRQTEALLAQDNLLFEEQAIKKEASLAYARARYLRERSEILVRQDSLLKHFFSIAATEFQAGNISRVNKVLIEARSMEATRQSASTYQEYQLVLQQIKWMTGMPDSVAWQPEQDLFVFTQPFRSKPPELLPQLREHQLQAASFDLKRQQKALLPGYGVGVVTNVDPKNRFLPNAYFSLNMPLFRKGQRAAIDAAKTRQLIAADDNNQRHFEAESRRRTAWQQLEAAQIEQRFADDNMQRIGTTVLEAAEIGRKTGDITTLEYIQALQTWQTLQLNQLEANYRFIQAYLQWHYYEVR